MRPRLIDRFVCFDAAVALLRRGEGVTFSSVAREVGCSYATAWRGLMDCVDDGILDRPMGRVKGGPHVLFRLTPKGEEEILWRAS